MEGTKNEVKDYISIILALLLIVIIAIAIITGIIFLVKWFFTIPFIKLLTFCGRIIIAGFLLFVIGLIIKIVTD